MVTCSRTGLSHLSGGEFDFFNAIWCGLSGGASSEYYVALFVFGGVMMYFTVLTRSFKIPVVILALLGSVFVTQLVAPAVGMAVMVVVVVAGGAIFYLMTAAKGSI